MTFDRATARREAARRLLSWSDTAVIQDATTILVMDFSGESMALVCEALAHQDAVDEFEAQETILGELAAAWRSGEVDVPLLLGEVRKTGSDDARSGAAIALDWLGVDT